MKSNHRELYFDLARALSAFWIVCIWHILAYLTNPINYVSPLVSYLAEVSLSCFMFMSGYFLGNKKINNFKDCLLFLLNRFWRFWILFFLSAVTLYVGGLLLGGDKLWFQNITAFITTITGLSSFCYPEVGTLWFMSMLMFYYFITPFPVSRH